jgi:biotin carboxylase
MSESGKKLLWVIGAGGAPFEYALPRLAALADVYAFAATGINAEQEALLGQWCSDVIRFDKVEPREDITTALIEAGRRYGVHGIITFSELAVIAVAEACLALGLPGPGPNARLARDKWLMRKRWAETGVPVPRFMRVENVGDLEEARRTLTLPILLKPSGRGGGIGQQVIDATTPLEQALHSVEVELEQAARRGVVEYSSAGKDFAHCVAEEIIDATTQSWYDDPRYGDYLSVEGIVARGVYHPISITARLPTLPSFAETIATSPCVLREDLQRKIERVAADAVNALGLQTCATHTELKLMSGNRMCLLETSARTGGGTATTICEAVFGIDMISLQTGEALGIAQTYPERMLVEGKGGAAAVYLFAADSKGTPWASPLPLHWKRLDWSTLISPESHVEVIRTAMPPDGTVITPYHAGGGALNYAGSVLLHSPDPQTLLADSYQLMDNLEAAVVAARDSAVSRDDG